ncbi:anthranilate synthase, component I [Anaerolinea thermolimosa]|uniref:anthranilate synthase component I n=1 Tax=Anaerolinea thermolimosa TaxID=229919 RepID=UPI0007832857|nr:anthranilate synthase component I [Anaerolinea thermolimosa]GAP08034.1 anthranilate synthase, component I [Anaerolinea thermolimosa]
MNQPISSPTTIQASAPLVRELPADLETPVSTYLKLAGTGPSFLLESVTGGERVARYSFIGAGLARACVVRGNTLEIHSADEVEKRIVSDPLGALKAELEPLRREPLHGLPRFTGGLVGYLGYEMMRFFEPSVSLRPHPDLPDAIFLLADTLVAFDHAFGRLLLIANPAPHGPESVARAAAEARLDELEARLASPLPPRAVPAGGVAAVSTEMRSNVPRERYMANVLKAKEYIAAGDIFQVVPSQRLSRETEAAPFDIYRALRRLNPSPYMFFFDFASLAGGEPLRLIGASPEMHVRLEGRTAAIRPIAGTRPRGKTPAEDLALEQDLLGDPKERAEHVMLVDLARNDLGRVCEYGTVRVSELMQVERYSHVMHIVSHVEGRLRPELDAFDLMRATFPAGTVTGAPKIRAMQIIDELESTPRGPYAGAVGYFAADGSMDTCIAIRTMVMRGKTVSVQAGGGVVADSDPALEYQESLNKARALAVAVEMAEKSSLA